MTATSSALAERTAAPSPADSAPPTLATTFPNAPKRTFASERFIARAIIVVSSVTTGIAWPNDAIYAATKAGVSRFARGLRNELAPRGIRVTDVVPGVIDTPLSREASVLPRAGATRVADAIVGAIRRPRNVVVTPSWYRLLLLVNRALPGVVDSVLRRTSAE